MKITKNIINWLILCMIMMMAQHAGAENKLTFEDVNVGAGGAFTVPVSLENDEPVVALQFSIYVPYGFEINTDLCRLTSRKTDHVIRIEKRYDDLRYDDYVCLVYSPTNSPLNGNDGKMLDLAFTVTTDFAPGSTFDFTVYDMAVSNAAMENLVDEWEEKHFTVTINEGVNLVPESVTTDATSYTPGDRMVLKWNVKNEGAVSAEHGWTERLLLVDNDGRQCLLGSFNLNEALVGGGSVSRQAEFEIPLLHGMGDGVRPQVHVVQNTGYGSESHDNSADGSIISLANRIYLQVPRSAVAEGSSSAIRCSVSRSGHWQEPLDVTLSSSDSRVNVPEVVTIPNLQSSVYFYLNVVDNHICDDHNEVHITATTPEGEVAMETLLIEDDETPMLTLVASKREIVEGETFELTVSTDLSPAKDMTVNLVCNMPSRFEMPSQLVIKAGENTGTVMVKSIDDNTPDVDQEVTFVAATQDYVSDEAWVTLHDNDVPDIELKLSPSIVAESAGANAIHATLRRLNHFDNTVTVLLSDDSDGDVYFSSSEITIPAGELQVSFTIGVNNNNVVDGDRVVNITAGIYIKSCSCQAVGGQTGSVTQSLTVTDDDGPAITLTSATSMINEGGTARLTITRNAGMERALEVGLSSDNDAQLDYPHTVVIPAGQTSVTVDVLAKANDVTSDDCIVSFTAQASGFATGTCWVMITNQTLPDAVISDISVSVSEVEVKGIVEVSLTISNTGSAPLPSQTRTAIILDGNELLTSIYTQESLNPGSSVTMTKSVNMPDVVGVHTVHAVANYTNKVKELTTVNNVSQRVNINVCSPYSTTLTVDRSVYAPSEVIWMTGHLFGNNVANAQVEVYLMSEGYRQTIGMVTTDANGDFSLSYVPHELQMGHFVAGACYPGENAKTGQASFDIVGLQRTGAQYLTCNVLLGEPYHLDIYFKNPTGIDLHNVTVNVVSKPENYNLSFTDIDVLKGGESASINSTITGTDLTAVNNWELAHIEVVAEEEVKLPVTLYLYCRNPKAQLKADIARINTTMAKDQSRDYMFKITNIGKGNTGKITVNIPDNDWMTLATPMSMAALDQDESAQVMLRFEPTDDMPINIPCTGSIAINCENGDGLSIPFSIEPVSETTGNLIVDVCDEYTYYTAEAPHVQGAKVKVKHPTTGALICEGVTNDNGLYQVMLSEGYYRLEVSADKHESYSGIILIDPGRELRKVIDLGVEAITITWDVEETTVEDRYTITANYNYETNVPTPVVTIDGPNRVDGDNMAVGESMLIYFTLTNRGLIDALEVEFRIPEANEQWTIRALAYTEPFTLAAGGSVVIPVVLTRLSEGSQSTSLKNPKQKFSNCMAVMEASYKHMCGMELKENTSAHSLAVKACGYAATLGEIMDLIGSLSGGGGAGAGGAGGGAGGGGGGGGNVGPNPPTPNPDKDYKPSGNDNDKPDMGPDRSICDPMNARCYDMLLDELMDLLKEISGVYGKILSLLDLFNSLCYDTDGFARDKLKDILKELVPLYAEYCKLCDLLEKYNDLIACIRLFFPNLPELPPIPELPNLAKLNASYVEFNTGTDWIDEFNDKFYLFCAQSAYVKKAIDEFMGDPIWFEEQDESVVGFLEYASGLDDNEFTYENLLNHKPECISNEQLAQFIDRFNNSAGTIDETMPHISRDALKADCRGFFECERIAHENGYATMFDMMMESSKATRNCLDEQAKSVCASVSMQLSQQLVLTRQAFRGTLTVYNGNDTVPMRDVKLALTVTDEEGRLATSHEFQINPEALTGFEGELDLTSGWTLAGGSTGKATVMFIPTKYAAPMEDKVYYFGGALSYVDPFTDLLVTRELLPQALTVRPSPDLELDYFMQRDILGDDPFTDAIEPMVPAEFALLVNNKGYGDANNATITTHQPEITENNKGLLIDFTLLNGDEENLGNNVVDFGTIAAKSQAYAQWWLTSSLTGHFTSYDVSYTHVTAYDNPYLSLIDTVRVHELIHGFTVGVDGDKPLRGFLVNDLPDAADLPDVIHFTNAIEAPVSMSTASIERRNSTQFVLTVNTGSAGWNYGAVADPTNGKQRLVSVIRQSDGVELPVDNVWATDRTLRDAMNWTYENKLHYIVDMTGSKDSYLLTFEPRPDVELLVVDFDGVPTGVLSEPLTNLTVKFNKPVQAETFTVADVMLTVDGRAVALDGLNISQLNDTVYSLDLTAVTEQDGYYVLTVQTAGIKDQQGFYGSTGRSAMWLQFVGLIPMTIVAEPAVGGTVMPESGGYAYNEMLHLVATPSQGYTFSYWTDGEGWICFTQEVDYPLMGSARLMAVFQPVRCQIVVIYNPEHGDVTNGTSRVVDYGTEILLSAVPAEGYEFNSWRVNHLKFSTDPDLTLVVESDMTLEAVFVPVGSPAVTYPPEILCEVTPTEVIITATGDGQVCLYVDGELVDNPYVVTRGDEDVTITVSATAQEEGLQVSEMVTKIITIPKISDSGLRDLVDEKSIANVRYYNVQGQRMDHADGMTIVVITYTDGSVKTLKVIRD